jgi:hypothetical protein
MMMDCLDHRVGDALVNETVRQIAWEDGQVAK